MYAKSRIIIAVYVYQSNSYCSPKFMTIVNKPVKIITDNASILPEFTTALHKSKETVSTIKRFREIYRNTFNTIKRL